LRAVLSVAVSEECGAKKKIVDDVGRRRTKQAILELYHRDNQVPPLLLGSIEEYLRLQTWCIRRVVADRRHLG